MISFTVAWTLCLVGLIIYIILDYLKIQAFPKKFTIKKFLLKYEVNLSLKDNQNNTIFDYISYYLNENEEKDILNFIYHLQNNYYYSKRRRLN